MKSAVMLGVVGGLALALAVQAAAGARPLAPQDAPPRQETPPKQDAPAPKPAAPKASVLVPFFGNEKCPIDGRPIEIERFLEVDGQRVYACSAACLETMKLDGQKALELAYPEVKPLATRLCGVCAADMDAGKAVEIKFQGRSLKLCGSTCEKEFRKRPGVWLARITWPEVEDAGNSLCPIDDKVIDGVTVVIFKSTLVRLSAPPCVAAFEKDPEASLAKVKRKTG
jgi:hypothetical protein